MNMEVYELWQTETPYLGVKVIITLNLSEVNRNPLDLSSFKVYLKQHGTKRGLLSQTSCPEKQPV